MLPSISIRYLYEFSKFMLIEFFLTEGKKYFFLFKYVH